MKCSLVKKTGVLFVCASLGASVSAESLMWWRFEESGKSVGDVAPQTLVNSVPNSSHPGATAWSIESGVLGSNEAYMPKYVEAFGGGYAIYDPVTESFFANGKSLSLNASHAVSPEQSGCIGIANTDFPNGPFTAECFFRAPENLASTTMAPLLHLENTAYAAAAVLEFSKGKPYLRYRYYETGEEALAGNNKIYDEVLNDGLWHHAALVFDGTALSCYIDYNRLISMNLTDFDRFPRPDGLHFLVGGNSLTSNRNFPGEIDEVRISDEALAPDRFLRIVRKAVTDPDVVLHLTCDPAPTAWHEAGPVEHAYYPPHYTLESELSAAATEAGVSVAGDPAVSEVHAGVMDATGVQNRGSYETRATSTTVGSSFLFSRADETAMAPVGQSVTIEGFVKMPEANTEDECFVNSGSLKILLRNNNKILYRVPKSAGGSEDTAVTGLDYDDGAWHHIAMVNDASACRQRFYFDYREVGSKSLGDFALVTASIRFGGASKVSQMIKGRMDELRVTMRALRPDEFLTADHFSADSTVRAWLRFEDDMTVLPLGAPQQQDGVSSAAEFVARTPNDEVAAGVANTKSLSLRAEGAVARFLSQPTVPTRGSLTVELYMRLAAASGNNILLAQCNSSDDNKTPWWSLRLNAGGNPYVMWMKPDMSGKDSLAFPAACGGKTLRYYDNRWHHYAFSFAEQIAGAETNTIVTLYRDHVQVGQEAYANYVRPYPTTVERQLGVTLLFNTPDYGSSAVYEIDELRCHEGVVGPEGFLPAVPPSGLKILFR